MFHVITSWLGEGHANDISANVNRANGAKVMTPKRALRRLVQHSTGSCTNEGDTKHATTLKIDNERVCDAFVCCENAKSAIISCMNVFVILRALVCGGVWKCVFYVNNWSCAVISNTLIKI